MAKKVVESALERWWEDEDVVESASINVGRLEKGSHEFLINNYSAYNDIGVNRRLESDYFVVGGYQWAILVYPNGLNKDACGDISVFIVLKSECNEPVQTLHEFYLIDPSGEGEGKNWGYSFFDEPLDGYVPSHTRRNSIHGRIRFIDRATLEHLRRVYLKDDCLRIRCTIGVFINRIQDLPIIEASPEQTIYTDFEALLERKEVLLESKWGANVFFEVGNETICAHKSILGAQSLFFRSLFSYLHQPDVIQIPQMEPKILKAILWFMYTRTLVEEEEEASGHSHALIIPSFLAKMLVAAHKFGLKRLKKICESRISEKLSRESVPYLLHLADLCHATKLKDVCLKFAAENHAAVTLDMEPMLSFLEISTGRGVMHHQEEAPNLSRQKPSIGGKFIGFIKKLNLNLTTSLKRKKTKIN